MYSPQPVHILLILFSAYQIIWLELSTFRVREEDVSDEDLRLHFVGLSGGAVNKKSDLQYLQRPIKWRQATLWGPVPPTLWQPRTKRGAARSRGKHPRLWGRKWCHWPPRISRRQFPGNLSKLGRKFRVTMRRHVYNKFKALLKVQSRVTREFKSMTRIKFLLWMEKIS